MYCVIAVADIGDVPLPVRSPVSVLAPVPPFATSNVPPKVKVAADPVKERPIPDAVKVNASPVCAPPLSPVIEMDEAATFSRRRR